MNAIVVTLGAGHGGHDLGTVSPSGCAEKNFTLSAARQAAMALAATGRFDPALVRSGDWYADIGRRARAAELLHSHCHVELHADLSASLPKGAAVWFSADRPRDRLPAADLSRRIARVCRVPDCGARPRYDFGSLLGAPAGAEDYYALLEKAVGPGRGPGHVLYCEYALPPGRFDTEYRLRQAAARLGLETARAVAELFGVRLAPRLRPPAVPDETWEPAAHPVRLRRGLYYARAGPGPGYPSVHIVCGRIVTDCLEEKNGWFAVPGQGATCVWLSRLALDDRPPRVTEGPERVEVTRRDGFSLVLAEPEPGAALLGAVGPGTRLAVRRLPGYRLFCYGGWEGYLPDDAFPADQPTGR